MTSCLALFRFLLKPLLAGLLVASSATAVAADLGYPTSGLRGHRHIPNPMAQIRRFGAASASRTPPYWAIRDLGLPAQMRGAPPSSLVPTPYAINQQGDVAVAVCPANGCYNDFQPGAASAYLYDYLSARAIPLAKFRAQPGPPPIEQYVPRALNERGEVVGSVIRFAGQNIVSSPVIWRRHGLYGSTIALLDTTPGDQGTAFGINNIGLSVGSVYTGAYQENSFEAGAAVLFTGGTPVLLGANAPAYSDANAINDAGVAVGDMNAGAAAVFMGGVGFPINEQLQCPMPVDLCDQNAALAINKAGDVLGNYVGNYFDMGTQTYTGFLWKNNSFLSLGPTCFTSQCPIQHRAGDTSFVVALNDKDDFVGYYDGLPWVSFLPLGDANNLLPPNSGWKILTLAGINNRRQIIGQGYHAGYGTAARAFLLEPSR